MNRFDGFWLAATLPAFAWAAVLPALPPVGRWRYLAYGLVVVGVCFAGVIAAGRPADDFAIFWKAGEDVWAGRDPYQLSVIEDRPFFNPPSALPLFAGFAVLPLRVAFVVWTLLTILFGLILVPLCRWALAPLDPASRGLGAGDVWVLTAAVGLSNAFRTHLLLGQMGVFVAIMLILVTGAWARRWPVVAAVSLCLATVKVGTAIPFGMLFTRRGDGVLWCIGTGLFLGLILLATPPSEFPTRVAQLWANIAFYAGPGQINDYSNEGPHSADILGFDKLAYHAGVTDRGWVRRVQGVLLAVLTGWVAWEVVVAQSRPPAVRVVLVALLALVFLYHRNYDTVLLMLPIVYGIGQARRGGPGARHFWASAVCSLAVVFMPRKLLFVLTHTPGIEAPIFWPIRALILPMTTWLVLASMVLVWRGSARRLA
jgi:hypothetical protein